MKITSLSFLTIPYLRVFFIGNGVFLIQTVLLKAALMAPTNKLVISFNLFVGWTNTGIRLSKSKLEDIYFIGLH
jgi:hypothetical protein